MNITKMIMVSSICFWGHAMSAMENSENTLITLIKSGASCKTLQHTIGAGSCSFAQIREAQTYVSTLPQDVKLLKIQKMLGKSGSPRRGGVDYLYKELAAFQALQLDEGKDSSSEEEGEK